MLLDYEQLYYAELQRCIDMCKKVGVLLPNRQVSFHLESWRRWVEVNDVTREDIHKLCFHLRRSFKWQPGCGGKKIAVSEDGGVPLMCTTTIPCPKCKKTLLKRLGSFFRKAKATNVKATVYWTLKLHRHIWVGKGYNPDYSLDCVEKGYCACFNYKDWYCRMSINVCNCDCPSPLAHSSQVAKNCGTSIYSCGSLAEDCPCDCLYCIGTCDYNCDSGHYWSGSACLPIPVPPAKPLINKPLVNPILVNFPVVRAL